MINVAIIVFSTTFNTLDIVSQSYTALIALVLVSLVVFMYQLVSWSLCKSSIITNGSVISDNVDNTDTASASVLTVSVVRLAVILIISSCKSIKDELTKSLLCTSFEST